MDSKDYNEKDSRKSLDKIIHKALEQKLVNLFLEDVPKALEHIRSNEKAIQMLKMEMEKIQSIVEKLDKQMKEDGCIPIQNHLKMHKFVYWILSAIVPAVATGIWWLIEYLK